MIERRFVLLIYKSLSLYVDCKCIVLSVYFYVYIFKYLVINVEV